MARRVFFSFHYEHDIWRANQVRNSWVTKPDRETAGFWDASLWEEAKRKGDSAIKQMIDKGLENTSVTVVLIGTETAYREWVKYEILESRKRRNGLLAIYIHNIKDQNGDSCPKGENPFDIMKIPITNERFSLMYPTYDWLINSGYEKLGSWVEAAAAIAGR